MLYQFTIYPLECVFKTLYLVLAELLGNYGLALAALSIVTSLLIRPLSAWAGRLGAGEKRIQAVLTPQLDDIKAKYTGADRHHAIERLYKRYGYHPAMAARSAAGVLVQVPFLMAAYYMLSSLTEISGRSFLFIHDLGAPDALLRFVNVLPFVMTAVNLASAYTTEGFTKKDRTQAAVIALFFLVLLYTAPSALLIYWTCNNLWTLLGNLMRRHGVVLPSVKIGGKGVGEWIKSIPAAVCAVCAFALTLCVFLPIDVYLTNAGELWFTLRDLAPWMAKTFLSVLLVLLVLYAVFRKIGGARVFSGIILGLMMGLFVQGYIINADYGILMGNEIDWNAYRTVGIVNTIVWTACLLAAVFFAVRLSEAAFGRLVKISSMILAAVQFFSVCYVGANATIEKPYISICTTEHMTEISSKDNIIVFVLDMFDTKVFQEIRKKDPKLMHALDGFVYYPDATSVFGRTVYSVPQMLTGKAYDNSRLFSEYLKDAWDNDAFYRTLKSNNYDIGLYTGHGFIPEKEIFSNISSNQVKINENIFRTYCSLVLFRAVPHYLKPPFLIYSGDLDQSQGEMRGKYTQYSEDNVKFYSRIKNKLTATDKTNCFRFYHLRGAHPPFTMTREINYLPAGKKSTEYEQAVGALRIALHYISQMKKLKAYENATILITADHGHANRIAASPLVVLKKPGAHGKLKVSNNPVSFDDLHATLISHIAGNSSEFGNDFSVPRKDTPRRFYIMGDNDDLVLYSVSPVAKKTSSWKREGTIHRKRSYSYVIGEYISFTASGKGSNYRGPGFTHQDVGGLGASSKAGRAELIFDIGKANTNRPLRLTIKGLTHLPENISERPVTFSVNGFHTATFPMTEGNHSYEADIPREAVEGSGGVLKIHIDVTELPNSYSIKLTGLSIDYAD